MSEWEFEPGLMDIARHPFGGFMVVRLDIHRFTKFLTMFKNYILMHDYVVFKSQKQKTT